MASLINPTSIPSITALRQELDYGDPQLSRCEAFYDSVRIFRKTFVSSQGWDGSSIHDWKSREHQIALGEMVRSYLELHGNGKLFWPDDNSQHRANRYKYSTDSARIKRIMRQLFWRLNIQQHRNIKYKKNKDKAGEFEATRGKGPSHDLGIDTDVVGAASASRDAAGALGTPRSSTFVNLTDSPVDTHHHVANPALREAPSHPANGRDISEDLYRVPDSPDPRILPPPNQPMFAVISTGIGNDGRQVAPVANMEPSTKRARDDDRASASMSSKRAGKQPAGLKKSRSSPRKRKLRALACRATDEEVFAAIQSPERKSSPEVVESPAPAETNNVVTSEIFPPWSRGSVNPYRATVSEVTDEGESASRFIHNQVQQLNAETGLDPAETSNSTNHTGPLPQETLNEAAHRASIEVKSVTGQSSPIHVTSSSVPPEGREVVDDRPTENKDAAQALPAGQPSVEFLYRVVCRYPERQSFSWKPEGSFRNKTLSRLEEELPIHLDWSQFQYLHFRLVAPKTRAEHLVCRGREDQFDSLKRHLTGIIQDCIADTPCGNMVVVEIDIEPLADLNSVSRSTDREAMDFDW